MGIQNVIDRSKQQKEALKKRTLTEQKRQDFLRNSDFESSLSVQPADEIALVNYYNSIDGVVVDPSIQDFWEKQQSSFDELHRENESIAREYANVYSSTLNYDDSINRINRTYKVQLKAKMESLRSAKKQAYNTSNEQNILKTGILALTGNTGEAEKVHEANKAVSRIEKEIKRFKQETAKSINEYRAKQTIAEKEMEDLADKAKKNSEKALVFDKNSVVLHNKLAPQYKIVDRIKSIQTFKKSHEYVAARNLIKSQNPDLSAKLDRFPESVPEKVLRISAENPLDLSNLNISGKDFSEIEQQINEIKGRLPSDIDLNDIEGSIEKYSLKETDTVQSLEDQMNNISDKNSTEYKRLEMKRDHLKLGNEIESTKKDIEALKQEIINDPSAPQDKLQELSNKQNRLKILEEEYSKDQYSTTLADLKKVQELLQEKDSSLSYEVLKDCENISNDLRQSQIMTSKGTVSQVYQLICMNIKTAKDRFIKQYEGKQQEVHDQAKDDQRSTDDDEGR